MRHVLVVIEAVLLSGFAAVALARTPNRLLAWLALFTCQLAPVVITPDNDLEMVATSGLLTAQAALVWTLVRKGRLEHQALLGRVKLMLEDRLRNKLQVLTSAAGSVEVWRAARELAGEVDELSEASLAAWETQYRHG